jgi:hypothetical protein
MDFNVGVVVVDEQDAIPKVKVVISPATMQKPIDRNFLFIMVCAPILGLFKGFRLTQ